MSEFHVEVVRVGEVKKHPNADSLSITLVNGGYPVVIRTGDFKEGECAVYVPIDSVVPDRPEWAFLGEHRRIKAKRLRGVFSMGMLMPASRKWKLGQNVQAEMGIEKFEPITRASTVNRRSYRWWMRYAVLRWLLGLFGIGKRGQGNAIPAPDWLPTYTSLKGWRRYEGVFKEGEEVILTEKIHGQNGRWGCRGGKLWAGSHNVVLRETPGCTWWGALRAMEQRLISTPGILWFGEVYGPIQSGFHYGTPEAAKVRMFDAFDTDAQRYLDYDAFAALALRAQLPIAPILYRGPWSPTLVKLAEGDTTIIGGDHIREGWVGRPVAERHDYMVGRCVVKLVGEGYLTSKHS